MSLIVCFGCLRYLQWIWKYGRSFLGIHEISVGCIMCNIFGEKPDIEIKNNNNKNIFTKGIFLFVNSWSRNCLSGGTICPSQTGRQAKIVAAPERKNTSSSVLIVQKVNFLKNIKTRWVVDVRWQNIFQLFFLLLIYISLFQYFATSNRNFWKAWAISCTWESGALEDIEGEGGEK